jgi:hypothetical protein
MHHCTQTEDFNTPKFYGFLLTPSKSFSVFRVSVQYTGKFADLLLLSENIYAMVKRKGDGEKNLPETLNLKRNAKQGRS